MGGVTPGQHPLSDTDKQKVLSVEESWEYKPKFLSYVFGQLSKLEQKGEAAPMEMDDDQN